ncbi:MAG: lytic murein transglycosylase [bacterium]|nr:lytic murein transglycosylase [bacterium]
MFINGHFSLIKKAILIWLFLSLGTGLAVWGVFQFQDMMAGAVRAASIEDLKENLQNEIEELEKKIRESQKIIDQYSRDSVSLKRDINIFNQKIAQLELEINQIKLSIQKLQFEISKKSGEINQTEGNIAQKREVLGKYLKQIYEDDQKTLLEMLLKNRQLSELFDDLNSLGVMQVNVYKVIDNIREEKEGLMEQKNELGGQKNEVLALKAMIDIQKRSLEIERLTREKILKDTQGKEAKYAVLVVESKKKMERLRQELSYLEQAGISTTDAVHYAKLTAARTGVRPAFLLAILEIESEMGANIGRGNWQDDMYKCYINYGKKKIAEQLKDAFFSIVKKLGLNSDSVPVSKRQPKLDACGGALGIAQFMPTTWLAYEARISKFTGHNPPSPWNFEDAFTATGLYLADRGAAEGTRAAEERAARAYVGGSSACSSYYCNIYAAKALKLAAILEEQL